MYKPVGQQLKILKTNIELLDMVCLSDTKGIAQNIVPNNPAFKVLYTTSIRKQDLTSTIFKYTKSKYTKLKRDGVFRKRIKKLINSKFFK
jgi:hypothetical protein